MNLPTPAEINSALARLENYRVKHVQELLYPYKPIPASIMLALGFRESGLRNICGGAKKDPATGKWVKSFGDRSYLQISDQYDGDFLKSVEGCPDGWWVPDAKKPAVSAFEPMHVPRFSPATLYVKDEMEKAYAVGVGHHVPDPLRFAVAAHNAGVQGALDGLKAGDVDVNTAGGDYSAYVLKVAPMIHDWIVAHPNWSYHPS